MEATTPRFKVGETVRVREDHPGGNPRTPWYIRGKTGVVVELHGVIDNPIDHRGHYPFLYTVMFEIGTVFDRPGHEKLCLDVHEEWLMPV